MKGRLICDSRFENHRTTPGHPEGADRIQVIRDGLQALTDPPWSWKQPRRAQESTLEWIHPQSYVHHVQDVSAQNSALDADTPLSTDSFETALYAAGSGLYLVRRGVEDDRPGFGAVRPPGHHAEPSRGMGFCLFNNIALAAEQAVRSGHRVAIVDIDVHHGNGTQAAFYDRSDVLYVSFHQFPFYPGTGARDETGEGEGEGYTCNIPLSAGSGWNSLEEPWRHTVEPALKSFDPDYLMVSAGFDAHATDPLGGLNLTDEDFLTMARDLHTWANRYCDGRVMGLLEGGYNRSTLQRLVPQFVSELFSDSG